MDPSNGGRSISQDRPLLGYAQGMELFLELENPVYHHDFMNDFASIREWTESRPNFSVPTKQR